MYIEPGKIRTKISDEEISAYKRCVLNILIDFDSFLKSKGIKYSLDGGTLLGAIRHNGFIPWDDDIDIALSREEFLKLLDVIDEFNSDVYEVYKPLDDSPIAISRMIKIYDKRTCIKEYGDRCYTGAFIDVFSRIDVSNNSKKERESNTYRLLTTLLLNKNGRLESGVYKTRSGQICHILSKFVSKSYLKRRISSYYHLSANSEYCFSSFGNNKYFKKSLMDEYTEHIFEGHVFPIIKEYDEFLKALYGDYMKYPPESERNPHHLEYMNLSESYVQKNNGLV
ncbi:MAG: phosphorylcholine transferase LicD [Erysipelotrichaceae bacterium]